MIGDSDVFYDIKKAAERIRLLRKRSGYTQEMLAQMLNIDRSYYSRIESSKSSCSVELFVHISEIFGVSLDYLVLGKYTGNLLNDTERLLAKSEIEKLMTCLDCLREKL